MRILILITFILSVQLPLSAQTVRLATFNVSLYDHQEGQLAARLSESDDSQAAAIAEIIQRVRPDILLLNEFDYQSNQQALKLFQSKYLSRGQNFSQSPQGPAKPIEFAYSYTAASNTGQPSGFDLDRDGVVQSRTGSRQYGGDCWGFGQYPGQYAMAILSRYPINSEQLRTFQHFRWRDMPEARLPDNLQTEQANDWYSDEVLEKFPLSSKSHWDVPIQIGDHTIHVLASHPTPPTFDGPEDRNGRRNHDEIRFWADYINPQESDYIYDDQGKHGGLSADARFVIMGDLNSDPVDGQGKEGIRRLLDSPWVDAKVAPQSDGGEQQAKLQGGANRQHQGNPRLDTLDAADPNGPGNLRVDYVLPSKTIKSLASAVFWPENTEWTFSLVGVHPFPSSDHRLVWIDIELPDTSK